MPWDIYPIYNDIDPSIVRIAFYLSFIFKSVIQAFFAIFFFYIYIQKIFLNILNIDTSIDYLEISYSIMIKFWFDKI